MKVRVRRSDPVHTDTRSKQRKESRRRKEKVTEVNKKILWAIIVRIRVIIRTICCIHSFNMHLLSATLGRACFRL